VRVLFHEPYLYFTVRRPWLVAAALAQRAMAGLLIRASDPVYVSTETWLRYLAPYGASAVRVLPIPATIPAGASTTDVSKFRIASGARAGEIVIGHFGTYGDHVTGELVPSLAAIAARRTAVRFALLGTGSKGFLQRLRVDAPSVAERAWATDHLPGPEVAAALRACDLVVQPYPDGVTTRRTSVMAALINGVPTVTTQGRLTESIWSASRAVSLARAGHPSEIADAAIGLANDAAARAELGMQGRRFYDAHFALERTLETLRGGLPASTPALTIAQ
jgi:glycosyltransferase involved in cell wall biosynthesis